ncbi:MAG TPA: c-type cytochrome [Candidatus Acidoferrales bacterium]|nr:c-type cytochrome [Candidatus Acidoferrales bacterium]
MRPTTPTRLTIGAAAILALMGTVLIASVTRAADAPPPAKAAYTKYCGACHGAEGKGDGVVSGFLRPPPTDLTQLAKKAGGKFPFKQTMDAIDGTTSVRAHGDPNMPVWGESFRREVPDANPQARARGKLMLITQYIESIQQK